MVLTWENFSDAPSDKGLICIVKHGDIKTLCGANVDEAIKTTRMCPKCRRLRREAIHNWEGVKE